MVIEMRVRTKAGERERGEKRDKTEERKRQR